MAWIPFIRVISSGLYTYIQNVQAYIAPPIAAVFLVGVLWSKANARGAMAALLTGFVIGTTRLLLEINKPALSGVLLTFASINFLHFALLLFAVSVFILVVAGLAEPEPLGESAVPLILKLGTSARFRDGRTRANIALSTAVVLIVIVIWTYFS